LGKSRKHASRSIGKISPANAVEILQAALNQCQKAGLNSFVMNVDGYGMLGMTVKNAWVCLDCGKFQVGASTKGYKCGCKPAVDVRDSSGSPAGSRP